MASRYKGLRLKIQFKHRRRVFLFVSRRIAGSSDRQWVGIRRFLDLSSSPHISRISCFRFFLDTNPAFAFSHACLSSASFCMYAISLAASSISSCVPGYSFAFISRSLYLIRLRANCSARCFLLVFGLWFDMTNRRILPLRCSAFFPNTYL